MVECSTIPVQDNHQLLVKICHPWTWRIANVFMAVFFSLAAYVQVSVFVCQHKMRNFIPSVSIDPLNSLTHNLAVVLLIIETASKIRVEVESKKMMTCVHKKKIFCECIQVAGRVQESDRRYWTSSLIQIWDEVEERGAERDWGHIEEN